MLIQVIFLIFGIYMSEDCIVRKGWMNLAVHLQFLRTCIPLSESEINQTLTTVNKMVDEYPYVDIMRNPPSYYSAYKFDEKEELKNVNKSNGLDFYQDIMKITSKMQDGHHTFYPPFLPYFHFFIPLAIDTELGDSLYSRKFKFVQGNFNFCPASSTCSNYIGKYITDIDFNGGNNLRPITQVLTEVAASCYPLGFNPHAQFNALLKQGIQVFGYSRCPYPKGDTLKARIKSGSGEETMVVELPWLAGYTGSDGEYSFSSLNPPVFYSGHTLQSHSPDRKSVV